MRPVLYDEDIELLYKEDYREARQRIEAFCESEVLDRVCISVVAPRTGTNLPAERPIDDVWSARHEWVELPEVPSDEVLHTDINFAVEYFDAYYKNTFWGGEAMPMHMQHLAFACFGFPEVTFSRETVWPTPWLPRSSLDVYQFDPNNRWFRLMWDVRMAVLADSRGKYLLENCMLPPTDILSSLRGPSELCLDIMDRPDEVHAMLDYLTQVQQWTLERIYAPVLEERTVAMDSPDWRDFEPRSDFSRHRPPQGHLLLPPWCAAIDQQCDFSAMIGPEHFREFVMPEVVYLADYLERTFYHLDGPQALRHLPALLEVDKINYIQWVSGAGQPDGIYWQDVWEAVRASGKGMQTFVSYDRVEETVKEWGPKGLWIVTKAWTEEAARDLLKRAERWSCQHPWDIR